MSYLACPVVGLAVQVPVAEGDPVAGHLAVGDPAVEDLVESPVVEGLAGNLVEDPVAEMAGLTSHHC
jgi:hypothetical protein